MTLKVSPPFASPSQTMLPGALKVSFTVGILVLTGPQTAYLTPPLLVTPSPHPTFYTENDPQRFSANRSYFCCFAPGTAHIIIVSYADLPGKAVFGSISQMVKQRLTDTQGHTVNQGQSWGQTTLADPLLLQVPACHKLQTPMQCSKDLGELTCGVPGGSVLSSWCPLELLWCRAPCLQLVRPSTSCQLSRLPALCFLPHPEPAG